MKIINDIVYGASSLDLCLPDSMPAPLFLYFHGGGLEAGDKSDFQRHAEVLARRGIASASANYRMYPSARFPDFIRDAAEATAFLKAHGAEYGGFDGITVGGSSAGGYLSMMLYFDKTYLNAHGIDPDELSGYVFDAGQPTTHYNVLRERGIDPRAIRVDEASPLYFIDRPAENPLQKAKLLFLAADNDMPGRLEQHYVLLRTLYTFGYSPARVTFRRMSGYNHCGYTGKPVFADMVSEFILPGSAKD